MYHHAKFYPNRFSGFGSAHAWFRAPRYKVTEAPKGHREFFFAIISGSDIISDPEIIAKNFPDVPSALPCKARWYKVTRLFFGGSWKSTTAETRAPILTQNTSNDAVPRKEVPFRGRETNIKGLDPHFPELGTRVRDPRLQSDSSLCFWDLQLTCDLLLKTWDLTCDSSTKTWDLLETRPKRLETYLRLAWYFS